MSHQISKTTLGKMVNVIMAQNIQINIWNIIFIQQTRKLKIDQKGMNIQCY